MKSLKSNWLPIAAIVWMLAVGTLHAAGTNLVYTDSAVADVVRYQGYDGAWSGESSGPDTNDTGALKWHLAATSPDGTEQAMVAMGFGGSPKHVYVSLYDGVNWDDGSGAPLADAKDLGGITNQSTRCFAAAYEQLSGHLLVVSGNTTSGQIQYWLWDGASWTINGSTYSVTGHSGTVTYAAIDARPNSNQIALIIKTGGEVTATIWDGDTNSWGNDKDLASFTDWAPVNSIDVAYTQAGPNAGQAVFVWAEDGDGDMVNDDVYSWTWTGSSWDASNKTVWSQVTTYYMEFLRLAADPYGDDLLLGIGFEDQNIYTVPWNGSSWGTRRTAAGTVYPYRRGWDLIFETGSSHRGHALLVYSQYNDDDLHYKHTTDITAAWGSEQTIAAYNLHWLDVIRDPDGTIHAVGLDENDATSDHLIAYSWDNSTWTSEGTLESGLDSNSSFQKPFALAPALTEDNDGKPLMTYTDTVSDNVMRHRRYFAGWGPESDAYDTGLWHPLYHRAATRPDGTGQVVLASNYGGGNKLFGSVFDGSSWTTKDFGVIGDAAEYRFDAVYEDTSRQLLVVSGTGTSGEIKYWVWSGSSWIVDGTTYALTNLTDTVKGIEVSSRPGTNQIALVAIDGANRLAGLIWDGDTNSWGNEQLLSTAPLANDNEPAQVEYMLAGTGAGQALFVWSESNAVKSRIWTGSAWDGTTTTEAVTSTPVNMRLAADPYSDDLLLAYYDSSKDIHTLDWGGSAWGTQRTVETDGYPDSWAGRPFDILFETASGHTHHALVVYSDSTGLRYRHTSDISGNWSSETTVLSDSDNYIWIQLARDGEGTVYMGGEQYNSGSGTDNYLAGYTWDSSTWTSDGILDSNLYYETNKPHFAVTAKPLPNDFVAGGPSEGVYRSVGVAATDLNTDSRTVTVSGFTATFSGAMSDRVGVGDAIVYNADGAIAFIVGRTTATVFSVKDKDGAAPAATSGSVTAKVYRSYTALSNWQSQTANTSIPAGLQSDVNPSQDLVTADTVMMVACYADGADNSITAIDGWTTGASNYIRIFTPTDSTDVGVSQRHTGIAGTGYRIAPVDATIKGYVIVDLRSGYIRIEGIEIDGSGLTNASIIRGIAVKSGLSNVGDLRIESCIIHDLQTSAGTVNYDNTAAIWGHQSTANSGPPLRIVNNIIYDVTSTVDQGNHHISGIHFGSRTTSYLYNNTIYNIHNQGGSGGSGGGAAWGITLLAWESSGDSGTVTVIAKNNYIGNVIADGDTSDECFNVREDSILNESYNVVSDGTAGGTGSINNQSAYSTYFTDITAGSEDLHLTDTAANLWGGSGEDLSSEFTADVDGDTRATPWDMGADDFGLRVRQAHYRWRHDNGGETGTTYEYITKDDKSKGALSSGTQLTIPHTTSGTNRLMLVAVSYGMDFESPFYVSSVTYNGTSMGLAEWTGGSFKRAYVQLFKLVAPDTGTHDVVVTFGGSMSSTQNAVVGVVTFNGVDQTTPLGTVNGSAGNGLSNDPFVDVSAASGDMVFGFASSRAIPLTLDTTGAVQRWNLSEGNWGEGAGATKAGANGTVTLTWTNSNTYWATCGVAIKPASAGSTGASFAAAEDIKIGLSKESPKRLRMLTSNRTTLDAGAATFQLQVAETDACSVGTYYALSGSEGDGADWEMVDSGHFSDAAATSNISGGLSDPGSDTFVAGQLKDTSDTTGGITLTSERFSEVEYAVQATSSATAGGNYCFRLYETSADNALDTYAVYAQAEVLGVTAVDLLSLSARGQEQTVRVAWETGQEIDNKGFHLYRSGSPAGPWIKLNRSLIPAASISGEGRAYSYTDTGVSYGSRYYYKLEDVDFNGTVTTHGPVCVDWDADGMPDDWEIAHGLDPLVDDALFDNDVDGLSNLMEYKRGTDPENPDTDGDDIPDGSETKAQSQEESGRVSPTAGVDILSEDDTGITLELSTSGFDFEEWVVGFQSYERLAITDYLHGYTEASGWPLLPLKGIMVDLPEGRVARLSVLSEDSDIQSGYQVYPVPTHELLEDGTLREVFFYNQQGYGSEEFYPATAADLGDSYVFGSSVKQKIVFHPLSFNPVTGDLLLRGRIRIRVDFIEADATLSHMSDTVRPWMAPASTESHGGAFAPSWPMPAPNTGHKIIVGEEGIYSITREWLMAMGLLAAEIDDIELSTVGVYYLGEEVAIEVSDQNGDDVLDAADYIRFYGKPVSTTFAKYAKHNVYWLSWGASGKRMEYLDGTPAGAADAGTHHFRVRHELDQLYLMSARGSDDIDRWVFSTVAFGETLSHPDAGKPRDFDLFLPGVAGDGSGELTIRMYSPYDADHQADIAVNGFHMGTAEWSGAGYHSAHFEAVELVDRDNTVSVACTSGEDKILFDWFSVRYQRAFEADSDRLRFSHETGYRFPVAGFSSSDVLAFDITDNTDVRRITNPATTGKGPWSFAFEPPFDGAIHTYLLLTTDRVKAPVGLQPASADRILDSAENQADWLLITHRDLGWDEYGEPQDWLTEIVAHRQSRGLTTMAVDVNHIYDVFSYGIVTPQAIKDFIAYACSNWRKPAPRHVLIVSDASYDVKDNWNVGTRAHVPSPLIFTKHLGETASDQWFVQVAGPDALPDLSIGRLPANSAAQAAAMIRKIISYEQPRNSKSWERAVVLVADNKVEAFESIFEAINEEAAARVPAAMDIPSRFYLQEYQQEHLATEDLTADLINALNTGALLVNYSGHAGYASLASELIFDNRGPRFREDADLLVNRDRYPFMISMSCLAGYFLYPEAWSSLYDFNYHSLAEALIRPANHGVVAALMPTGMSTPEGQHIFNSAIFEEIFTNDRRIIGDALLQARLTLLANTDADYREVSDTFMLFGDPATKLKLPLPERPEGLAVLRNPDGSTQIQWDEASDCNGEDVAGYNIYRRASDQKGFLKINTGLVTDLIFTDDTPAATLSHSASAAAGQTTQYYAITSVDDHGDESAQSIAATPAAGYEALQNITQLGDVVSSASGGGCFIRSAAFQTDPSHRFLFLSITFLVAIFIGLGRPKSRMLGRSLLKDKQGIIS